jgi:hypothetical protein
MSWKSILQLRLQKPADVASLLYVVFKDSVQRTYKMVVNLHSCSFCDLWICRVPGIFTMVLLINYVGLVIAFYQLIVYKMWEPSRLTTLWAPEACFRERFKFIT